LDQDSEIVPIENLETTHMLEVFPQEMELINWVTVFNLRFPQYYSKDLYIYGTYGVRSIYLELLLIPKALLEGAFYNETFYDDNTPAYKHAHKYLMLKDFISTKFNIVTKMDDIDLFKKIYEKNFEGPAAFKQISTYMFDLVDSNSMNILKYIFENGLYQPEEDDDEFWKNEIYRESNDDLNLQMTKILFENVNYSEYDKIWILTRYGSENRKSYDYILNTLKEITDNDLFFNLLTHYDRYDIIFAENFRALWNKFGNVFTSEQIIKLYHGFSIAVSQSEKINMKDVLKITALIAHHPVIEKEYLS
jgi:hypothetical protein